MRFSNYHIYRRAPTSIPAVGSSRKTNGLRPTNAIAIESLRFCPPDKLCDGASILSTRSTYFSINIMLYYNYLPRKPLILPKYYKCSRQVSYGHKMLC